MKTYTIRNKATVRVAQALADALNVPLKPYDQFYLPMLGRYAKTQREQIEALLDLVNKGLAVYPEALENAKYSDGAIIFDCRVELQEEKTPYIESIILNDIIPAQKESIAVNDTISRLLALRSKCTTNELTSLNRIILEVDGQLNMNMAAYSYHANNIAHLLCADDKFSLVPGHVVHHGALCDDSGDYDDMGMQSYADAYHNAQKVKYGLL